jgi:hypothetical protein
VGRAAAKVAVRVSPVRAVLVPARAPARTSPEPRAVAKRVVGPALAGRVVRAAIAEPPSTMPSARLKTGFRSSCSKMSEGEDVAHEPYGEFGRDRAGADLGAIAAVGSTWSRAGPNRFLASHPTASGHG